MKTTNKTKRGGARPGSGRKKLYAEPLIVYQVKLPASIRERVMKKGPGWVRELIIRELNKKE